MAGSFTPIYRNLNDSDMVMNTDYTPGTSTFPTIDVLGWSKDGYQFKEYNLSRDGTSTSYHPGENVSTSQNIYVIWEEEPPSHYIVERTGLEAVADAVRAKSGTTDKLTWPSGFINAIGNISGSDGMVALYKASNSLTLYSVVYDDINQCLSASEIDVVYGYLPYVSFLGDGENVEVYDSEGNYYETIFEDVYDGQNSFYQNLGVFPYTVKLIDIPEISGLTFYISAQ